MDKKAYLKHLDYVIKSLSKKEIDFLASSSCGPANNKFLAWLVPDFFKKPCKDHDIGYAVGGTEQHRKWCDRNFYNGCRNGFWLFRPFAKTFYKSVRKYGGDSWFYNDKPLKLHELRDKIKVSKS